MLNQLGGVGGFCTSWLDNFFLTSCNSIGYKIKIESLIRTWVNDYLMHELKSDDIELNNWYTLHIHTKYYIKKHSNMEFIRVSLAGVNKGNVECFIAREVEDWWDKMYQHDAKSSFKWGKMRNNMHWIDI